MSLGHQTPVWGEKWGNSFCGLLTGLPASVSTPGTPGVRGFPHSTRDTPSPRVAHCSSHSPIRLTACLVPPQLLCPGGHLPWLPSLWFSMHENPLPSSPEGSLKAPSARRPLPASPSSETPTQSVHLHPLIIPAAGHPPSLLLGSSKAVPSSAAHRGCVNMEPEGSAGREAVLKLPVHLPLQGDYHPGLPFQVLL